MQRSLIALERDVVIGLLVFDLFGDGALASHGVDRHDGAFDRHHLLKRGNRDDLVGLLRHVDLSIQTFNPLSATSSPDCPGKAKFVLRPDKAWVTFCSTAQARFYSAVCLHLQA
ncbi:hypothetical protein H2LOC_014350 [Methylocystis heyeri]|uniref:Uncharacterized protein n=1 Tax=Methylocystis heyeri TaxID=391905 RepID=A0A6B8KGN1_9HYPH|nr:hypothetical protein H2LOC_014350 [Methylocystis heyeri]